MYKIGVLSKIKGESSSYLKELTKKQFELILIDPSELVDHMPSIDTLLIDYSLNEQPSYEEIGEFILTTKQHSNLFIWILVNKSTKIDRLIFAQLGAGAVFDQRIQPDEFVVYLANFLQRSAEQKKIPLYKEQTDFNSIILIPKNMSLILDGNKTIFLTKIEYKFLNYLAQKKDNSATYQEIATTIWPKAKPHPQQQLRIANIVFRLRQKIEQDPSKPRYLKTIRSVGYRFCNGIKVH